MEVTRPDSLDKVKDFLRLSNLDEVILSKMFFRDYACLKNCAGCCKKNVSLDYKDGSERWEKFKTLYPQHVDKFTSRKVGKAIYWTDFQDDNKDPYYCKHVDQSTGYCNIHEANPFSCEFVLAKFIDNKARGRSLLTSTLYGRAHNFKRVDGGKGALCYMTDYNHSKFLRDVEMLDELVEQGKAIGEPTEKLEVIIQFLKDQTPNFEKGIFPKENILFKTEEKDGQMIHLPILNPLISQPKVKIEKKRKFMDLFNKKETTLEEIHSYIEEWHTSDSKLGLHEFLGMTKSEYVSFIKNPNSLTC